MSQTSKLSHGTSATASSSASASISQGKTSKAGKYAANPSGIVIGLTMSMGWQLALVVLLPLLGGHFLDNKLKTSPYLALTGLLVAMVLMILVVRRTLQQLNEYTGEPVELVEKDKA